MLKIKLSFVRVLWSFFLFPLAGFGETLNFPSKYPYAGFIDVSIKTERKKLASSIWRVLNDEPSWYRGKPPTSQEMEAEQSRLEYIHKLADIDPSRYRKEFLRQQNDPLGKKILRFHSYSRLQRASNCLAANYSSLGKRDEVVCYRSILAALDSFRNDLEGEDELVEFMAENLRQPLTDAILGASGAWPAYHMQRMKGGCSPTEYKKYLGGCPKRGK